LPCHCGGNVQDWFFLAMTHARLGKRDEARRWYDRAVAWLDTARPRGEEIDGLRKEATEVLHLDPGKD
jgi:hypothetical protein